MTQFDDREFYLVWKMRALHDVFVVIQKRVSSSRGLLSNFIFTMKRVWWKLSVDHKFSLKMEDSISTDTKTLAYEMCRDSIGGIWAQVQKDQFRIDKLSGGLTNYLYICSLPDHVRVPDNQPARVLLRVYGTIATSSDLVVQNSVVFALMSEKGLGPRLYGMTPQARLEEFIPSNALSTTDLHIPEMSCAIARKLARFHMLDMPICKEPRFIFSKMDQWVKAVTNMLQNNRALDKLYGPYKLVEELEKLKEILFAVQSPVVFSHNDLQEGNILYREGDGSTEDSLTIIDWEYCSYNYRGHDLGNHFLEWTFNYCVQEEPFFSFTPHHYPSRQQQYDFFRAYLEEIGEEVTDESLAAMYQEVNTFALASHFFWGLWSIVQNEESTIPFGYLEYATCRISEYFKMKQRLAEFKQL